MRERAQCQIMEAALKRGWYKLTRKTFHCPQCRQMLRVPVRPGKRLRVSCPRCLCETQVHFQAPLIETFCWKKGLGLKQNLIHFHNRFWNLPLNSKVQVVLWLLILSMMADIFLSWLFNYFENSTPPKLHLPKEDLIDLSPVI